MQFLFEIEDVFSITGRGCVLVPGIPHEFTGELKSGAALLICTPEGEQIHAQIESFEHVRTARIQDHSPFSVPSTIKKENIPVGSKVYLQSDLKK